MAAYIFLFGALGLIFGSFFNVVIHRLPQVLDHNLSKNLPKQSVLKNISYPKSHCPSCKNAIPWYDNIPLLSWVFLLGRCRRCRTSISPIYITVECITMLFFSYSYWRYGLSLEAFVWIAFFSLLILLFFIDLQSFYLPDVLTYTLTALGLLLSFVGLTGIDLTVSLMGGTLGFLLFFLINLLYKLWRKVDGFGGGDMKLLAGLGSWMGFKSLLPIVMLSSIIAICFAILMLVIGRRYKMNSMLPFGPFLILSGLMVYVSLHLYPIAFMRYFYEL